MPQQLNLYARSLCQNRQARALGHMLLSQGVLAALAVLVGAGLQWHTGRLQEDIQRLAAEAEVRRSALLPSTTSRTEQAERDQVKRLRDHEAALQRLHILLDSGSAGRREGYAAHLEALARQTHPAVWITGLTLQGSDEAIEIRGRMTDPAVLPDYLRGLQSEPRFKGRTFATLQIRPGGASNQNTDSTEPESRPGYSEFTLSSQAPRTESARP
jgi:Tfp pilus assembly protein PilN